MQQSIKKEAVELPGPHIDPHKSKGALKGIMILVHGIYADLRQGARQQLTVQHSSGPKLHKEQ